MFSTSSFKELFGFMAVVNVVSGWLNTLYSQLSPFIDWTVSCFLHFGLLYQSAKLLGISRVVI